MADVGSGVGGVFPGWLHNGQPVQLGTHVDPRLCSGCVYCNFRPGTCPVAGCPNYGGDERPNGGSDDYGGPGAASNRLGANDGGPVALPEAHGPAGNRGPQYWYDCERNEWVFGLLVSAEAMREQGRGDVIEPVPVHGRDRGEDGDRRERAGVGADGGGSEVGGVNSSQRGDDGGVAGVLVGGTGGDSVDPSRLCDVEGCGRFKGGKVISLSVSKYHSVRVVPCVTCARQLHIHGYLPVSH